MIKKPCREYFKTCSSCNDLNFFFGGLLVAIGFEEVLHKKHLEETCATYSFDSEISNQISKDNVQKYKKGFRDVFSEFQ